MKMKVLDLFSGIGGFSLGLERAGMQTVAFCEIEPYCRKVLRKHWPAVTIYEDITKLTATKLAADGISVDVICGGFPCQDISTAGKGAGIRAERSGLWGEYARLIGELRPRYVIVENVSALLGRGLSVVLGDLAAIGYDAEWHCITASSIGAPHRRDRVWIVGYPNVEPIANLHNGSSTKRSSAASPTRPVHAGDSNSCKDVAGPEANATRSDANSERSHRAQMHQHGSSEFRDEQEREPRSMGGEVANTPSSRQAQGRCRESGPLRDEARGPESDRRSNALADAANLPKREPTEKANAVTDCREARLELGGSSSGEREVSDSENGGRPVRGRPPGQNGYLVRLDPRRVGEIWLAEPNVGRVADGIPARVDRLTALGNSLVPQIPEIIGRAIMEAETKPC